MGIANRPNRNGCRQNVQMCNKFAQRHDLDNRNQIHITETDFWLRVHITIVHNGAYKTILICDFMDAKCVSMYFEDKASNSRRSWIINTMCTSASFVPKGA